MSETLTVNLPVINLSDAARKKLHVRFEVARQIYKTALGECERRRKNIDMVKWREYTQEIAAIYKSGGDKALIREIGSKRNQLKVDAKYYARSFQGRKDSIAQYIAKVCQKKWKDKDGSEVQSDLSKYIQAKVLYHLVDDAFQVSCLRLHGNKKHRKTSKPVKFGLPLRSITAENIQDSMTLDRDTSVFSWSYKQLNDFLLLDVHINDYCRQMLDSATKICYYRITRNKLHGRYRYVVQVIIEGVRPEIHEKGTGIVGMDLNSGHIGIATEDGAFVLDLLGELDKRDKQIDKLAKEYTRKLRSIPSNLDSKNNIRKNMRSNPLIISKRALTVKRQKANIERKLRESRRCLHGKLANILRSLGDVLIIEDVKVSTWKQKGKRKLNRKLSHYAVGAFETHLKEKFSTVHSVNTYKTKYSQLCPQCHKHTKTREKIYVCEHCRFTCDRDVKAAVFLHLHNILTGETDLDQALKMIVVANNCSQSEPVGTADSELLVIH